MMIKPTFTCSNDSNYFYLTLILLLAVYFTVFMKTNSFPIGCIMVYIVILNLLSLYRIITVGPGYLLRKDDTLLSVNKNDNSCVSNNKDTLLSGNTNDTLLSVNNEKDTLYGDFEGLKLTGKSKTVEIIPDFHNGVRHILFKHSDDERYVYIQKYCPTCCVFRPMKASHCFDCDRCILEKDHHCIWMNTCIGRNNHSFFMYFIYTLMALLSYCSWVLIRENVYYYSVLPLVVIFGAFILYHSFLLVFDVKSREFLNGRVNLKLDLRDILKRLCTIRPVIHLDSSNNSV